MPNTKSATREERHQKRRRAINLVRRRVLKTAISKLRKDPSNGENLSTAYKQLGKAAKQGILSKNKASRIQSRLAKNHNTAGTPKAAPKGSKPAKRAQSKKPTPSVDHSSHPA